MRTIAILSSLLTLVLATRLAVSDEHDRHGEEGEKTAAPQTKKVKSAPKMHEEEANEEGHGKSDEHGHGHGEEGEEAPKNVGPEKGITSFDEDKGFKLSTEAMKTFSIETLLLKGSGSWSVPAPALLLTGEEKSVYRVRQGLFKSIPVEVLSRDKSKATIRARALKEGDSIVTRGVGYLRIAEVDVTSAEVGHSH